MISAFELRRVSKEINALLLNELNEAYSEEIADAVYALNKITRLIEDERIKQ
jgi:hypothetical protein